MKNSLFSLSPLKNSQFSPSLLTVSAQIEDKGGAESGLNAKGHKWK